MKELLSGYAIKKEVFNLADDILNKFESSPDDVENTIVKLIKSLSYKEQLRVAETWPNHFREALKITSWGVGGASVPDVTFNIAKDIVLNEYSNHVLAA